MNNMNYLFLLLLISTEYASSASAVTLCPPIKISKPSPTPSPKPSPMPSPKPSPKPSPTPTGGNCIDIQDVIDTTNSYRRLHQVNSLTWDPVLARESGVYAEKLSKDCALQHSSGDYGENLYSMSSYPKPNESCKNAIVSWYSEVSKYDFNAKKQFSDNWTKGIGHFTQVVWKSTTSFGCGEHVREITRPNMSFKIGCKIVVCRYRPPGNMATDSAFNENVLPPK